MAVMGWRLQRKWEKINKGAWNFPKCLDCNKQLTHYDSKRCRKCANSGENSPSWKGGITRNMQTYNKEYKIKNREKYSFLQKMRKIRNKNAEGSHTFEEWENLKKLYNFMCLCCKRYEPEVILTEDHIVPITKGGANYIWNIQPLCQSCNSIKRVKTIDYRKEFLQ